MSWKEGETRYTFSYTKSQMWHYNSESMAQLAQHILESRCRYNPTVYINLLRYFINNIYLFSPLVGGPRLILGVVTVTSLFVQRRIDEGRSTKQVTRAKRST